MSRGRFGRRGRRIRFSLRFLLLLPILVAAYFACGPVTSTRGVHDVARHLTEQNDGLYVAPDYKAPLLLEFSVIDGRPQGVPPRMSRHTEYYFWLFGYVAKLPWSSTEYQEYPKPNADGVIVISWPGDRAASTGTAVQSTYTINVR